MQRQKYQMSWPCGNGSKQTLCLRKGKPRFRKRNKVICNLNVNVAPKIFTNVRNRVYLREFVPSYELCDEPVQMSRLIGYDYRRRWFCERNVWMSNVYGHPRSANWGKCVRNIKFKPLKRHSISAEQGQLYMPGGGGDGGGKQVPKEAVPRFGGDRQQRRAARERERSQKGGQGRGTQNLEREMDWPELTPEQARFFMEGPSGGSDSENEGHPREVSSFGKGGRPGSPNQGSRQVKPDTKSGRPKTSHQPARPRKPSGGSASDRGGPSDRPSQLQPPAEPIASHDKSNEQPPVSPTPGDHEPAKTSPASSEIPMPTAAAPEQEPAKVPKENQSPKPTPVPVTIEPEPPKKVARPSEPAKRESASQEPSKQPPPIPKRPSIDLAKSIQPPAVPERVSQPPPSEARPSQPPAGAARPSQPSATPATQAELQPAGRESAKPEPTVSEPNLPPATPPTPTEQKPASQPPRVSEPAAINSLPLAPASDTDNRPSASQPAAVEEPAKHMSTESQPPPTEMPIQHELEPIEQEPVASQPKTSEVPPRQEQIEQESADDHQKFSQPPTDLQPTDQQQQPAEPEAVPTASLTKSDEPPAPARVSQPQAVPPPVDLPQESEPIKAVPVTSVTPTPATQEPPAPVPAPADEKPTKPVPIASVSQPPAPATEISVYHQQPSQEPTKRVSAPASQPKFSQPPAPSPVSVFQPPSGSEPTAVEQGPVEHAKAPEPCIPQPPAPAEAANRQPVKSLPNVSQGQPCYLLEKPSLQEPTAMGMQAEFCHSDMPQLPVAHGAVSQLVNCVLSYVQEDICETDCRKILANEGQSPKFELKGATDLEQTVPGVKSDMSQFINSVVSYAGAAVPVPDGCGVGVKSDISQLINSVVSYVQEDICESDCHKGSTVVTAGQSPQLAIPTAARPEPGITELKRATQLEHPPSRNESGFKLVPEESSVVVMVQPRPAMSVASVAPSRAGLGVDARPSESVLGKMTYGVVESEASFLDVNYHRMKGERGESSIHKNRTDISLIVKPGASLNQSKAAVGPTASRSVPVASVSPTPRAPAASGAQHSPPPPLLTTAVRKPSVRDHLQDIRRSLDEIRKELKRFGVETPDPPSKDDKK